jgi:enhancing lycopene biosynthesis protein 2
MSQKPRIAVVLSGCGVYDGSEIHEAVCALLALDRAGAAVQCFAPDVDQMHVVDHLTGEPTGETRKVLVESARIARGKVADLATFDPAAWDGILLPGGFGAAKNLSTFAVDGADCKVDPSVEKAVRSMVAAGKPVAAMCIAPAVVAKILGDVEVTIGSDEGTAGAIAAMGARHRTTSHAEVVVDERRKVATTPCYMLDASVSQIFQGAENVVKALLQMAR